MVYITTYNFNRITKSFTTPQNKGFEFEDSIIWTSPDGTIYGQNNPSRLFAKWDINDLLLFKAFCKDTELAASQFYRILPKPVDSYRYVEPERAPSYHYDPNCSRLHSEFERVLIPEEIREQGINKVKEFQKRLLLVLI